MMHQVTLTLEQAFNYRLLQVGDTVKIVKCEDYPEIEGKELVIDTISVNPVTSRSSISFNFDEYTMGVNDKTTIQLVKRIIKAGVKEGNVKRDTFLVEWHEDNSNQIPLVGIRDLLRMEEKQNISVTYKNITLTASILDTNITNNSGEIYYLVSYNTSSEDDSHDYAVEVLNSFLQEEEITSDLWTKSFFLEILKREIDALIEVGSKLSKIHYIRKEK